MSVLPDACSVAAVVMMIAMAMTFETAMPTRVSMRIRLVSCGSFSGSCFRGFLSGSIRCSSASWEDCHTNRYGEIVVPRIATSVVRNAAFHCTFGISRPASASLSGTFATNSAMT